MNLHSLDIHRSFVHSTPPPPPPRFVVNNHPSPLSFSTHFGAGEKREAQQGSSPKKRKEKRREGKGREEKKKKREALPNSSSYRITITKSGTIVRTTFHDSFLGRAEGSKTKVQDEQGSRHHGTIMGMGGGVGGTQELSLKESKRRRMGKREDTKKDGHQVGRLLLPTPTLYISLLLPATSSVFQFERHTACTIRTDHHLARDRDLWDDGLLNGSERWQDVWPCARRFLHPGTCPIYPG